MAAPLIIVSGPPSSGKTTISQIVGQELTIPVIGKDVIKEILFDTLGWEDRDWSRKIGHVSIVMLFEMIQRFATSHTPLIAESNFHQEYDTPRFARIASDHQLKMQQVHCMARPDILIDRFTARAQSPNRHPGHVESTMTEEFISILESGVWGPLPLSAPLIEIDTTDWDVVDLHAVIERIRDL